MAMTGFFCQDKYLEQTKKLTDEELGRLFRACMFYHRDGIEIELNGKESMAFDFIRDDIDNAEQAYMKKCDQNKRNRNGGIERSSTDDNERQQPSTPVTNIKEDNVNKKEKEKNNNKDTNKRFTPPTVEEVSAYCKERGNKVDPEKFVAFYESKGWKVGNQPMKSWKASVITWEKDDRTRSSPQIKTVAAQQYEQRDYDDEQAEAMARMLKGLGA